MGNHGAARRPANGAGLAARRVARRRSGSCDVYLETPNGHRLVGIRHPIMARVNADDRPYVERLPKRRLGSSEVAVQYGGRHGGSVLAVADLARLLPPLGVVDDYRPGQQVMAQSGCLRVRCTRARSSSGPIAPRA
jgi:hypothetical protein